MKFDEGVQFDPGFVAHISAFVPNVEYLYNTINRFKNFSQKKSQFKMYFPKLEKLLDDYIAFYLGCMLWAAAIRTLKDKPVLNNFCCGAEYDEEETVSEVNFVSAFYEHLPKEVKYYTGKDFALDEKKLDILNNYKAFLIENKGFTALKTTGDIKMPSNFKNLKDADAVINKIEDVVETGNLTELYNLYSEIL